MSALTFDELDRFAQELAHLSRGGTPLPDGLEKLAISLGPGRLKRLADETAGALRLGKPLSQALRESSIKVPAEYVAVVECAEATGDLKAILAFANEQSRKVKRHRDAILTAAFYPAIVLVAAILIVTFIARVVLPEFEVIFQELGATELPGATQAAFTLGAFLRSGGGMLLVAAAVLAVLSLYLQPVRDAAHRVLGSLPVFRNLMVLSDTAIFCKFLSQMLRRGAPLPLALKAVSLAVWRDADRRMLQEMAETAERGQAVGPLLRGDLPSTAVYLFCNGEQRGDLPDACAGIAEYCEDRFTQLALRSQASFEPLLIVVIGVFVGALVVSLYLPLFMIPKIMGMQ